MKLRKPVKLNNIQQAVIIILIIDLIIKIGEHLSVIGFTVRDHEIVEACIIYLLWKVNYKV